VEASSDDSVPFVVSIVVPIAVVAVVIVGVAAGLMWHRRHRRHGRSDTIKRQPSPSSSYGALENQ
jgi:hypothetical protein